MNSISPLAEQFFLNGKVDDCPVYDLHGHMGPVYGLHLPCADTDKMINGMDRAGVKMLVFCHHASLLSSDIGNAPAIEAVRHYPDKLRAYCGINPNYPEITKRDIHSYDDHTDVYVGFKMLADYHHYPITGERYRAAWEMADRRGLMVLLHTWGGSQFSGYELLREVAGRYPGARIIVGHSIHGDWDKAVQLVKDFPNTYLELCAVMDERGILEGFVSEVGSERIVFGTDYPWFDFHYYVGAILGSDITDDDRRNILYRNAQNLLSGFGI